MIFLVLSFGYPDKYRRNKNIYIHEQIKALKSIGNEVIVIDLASDYSRFFVEEIFEDVKVFRLNIRTAKKKPFNVIKVRKKIRSILANYNIEIIVYHFIDLYYLLVIDIFKKIKKRVVITHGYDAMGLWERKRNFIFKKYLLRQFTNIFAVSEYTGFLVKTLISTNQYHKVRVIYNGINQDKLNTVLNKSKTILKEKIGLKININAFLTVCNLLPRKGVDVLLRTDMILKNQGIDFIHIIIGNGKEKEKLIKYVNTNNLQNNVLFIDYIKEDTNLAEYFRASDIFLMMSKTIYNPPAMEGFGIVYAEAQYLGIPVIGGNSGGVSTVVKHGFTGFLVDPDDDKVENKICEYIKMLIFNKELYNKISINAHNFVKYNFSWNKNCEEILRILSK